MRMMATAAGWLLGRFMRCRHKKMGWPTARYRNGEVYVTCLECGQQFEYDWATMRQGSPIEVGK